MESLILFGGIALAIGALVYLLGRRKSDPYEEAEPSTLPPSRPGIVMCYFGVQDGQIAATRSYVNAAHIGSWGDWTTPAGREALTDTMVRYAHEAVDAGITKLILTLDWCLFTQTEPKKLLPESTAVTYLLHFLNRLELEKLDPFIAGYYSLDEPNIQQNDVSDADMTTANALIRATMPVASLMCIYGSDSKKSMPFPGIASFDWCGIDNYGAPIFTDGEYRRLVDQLRPEQKTIYVPGGSDPWREDPAPYYVRAQADSRVAMIMPFAWFPQPDGIGFNGMQPKYDEVGKLIVEAK